MTALATAYHHEMALARAAARLDAFEESWRRMERAHVLSQSSAYLHTHNHVAMLGLALRTRDVREALGQVVRVFVSGLASALGRAPLGNPGRTRVALTQAAPIPGDLAAIFAHAQSGR
jgi:hypothetical protein